MNKQLKAWQKASLTTKVIIVVVAIVIIYFAYQFYLQSKVTIQQKAEVVALQAQGITASYNKSKYDSLANTIETAIAGLGTDEQAIYDTFSELNNDVDFIELDKAFGTRDGEDMRGWIKGDLSSAELKTLNNQLNNQSITKRI